MNQQRTSNCLNRRFSPKSLVLGTLALLASAVLAPASVVTMTASDASGTSSLTSAGKWSNTAAPSAANDYFSSIYFIRTPADAADYTFAGNSLTLQAPSGQGAPMRSIIFKGSGNPVITINNLTNAGGIINFGSGSTPVPTFTGNKMTVVSSSTIQADQGSCIIGYPIVGSATLTNTSGQGRTITYTGDLSGFTGKFNINSSVTVALNAGSSNLGNPASSTPDQITIGAGCTLLDNVGITFNNANGGITLAGSATINAATAGNNTVIAVPVTGAFALTKTGGGTLTLSGNNHCAGLILNGATAGSTLNINSATALGTNTFTISGGDNATIDNTTGSALTLTPNNAVQLNNNFAFAGTSDLNLGSGSVTMTGNRVITVTGNKLTFGGSVAGVGCSLTKAGAGTLTLGNTNSYTGNTAVSEGTLALTGSGSLVSTNISIASGATLDVSGLSATFTLGTSQTVTDGSGSVNGSVITAGNGSSIYVTSAGMTGTLTFSNNLNMAAGGTAFFDLGGVYNSGNDQAVVGGNLTLSSSDALHLNALTGGGDLDTTGDYVLFAVTGSTTMASTPLLFWDGTPPANYLNYSLVKSGNNVVLRYSSSVAPSVTATASPDTLNRHQATLITATVTPGSSAIASVKVNLSQIGGASAANLVLSDTPNVYTNTFTVSSGTTIGTKSLTVTVTDATPLTGTCLVSLTVSPADQIWNGAGSDNNWGSNPNWVSGLAPILGESVTFAGPTRLTPNLETNYSVTGVTFDGTAGSFNIGSATSNVLTLTVNGVVNNSANVQTLNVPIIISAAQTFNAAAGSLILNSNIVLGGTLTLDGPTNTSLAGSISGPGGLTKNGNGTLTLTGNDTFTGSVFASAGTVIIDSGGTVNNGGSFSSIGLLGSDIATLTLKGTGTFTNSADFNVGDIGSATGTLNLQDSAVLSVGQLFIASANAAGSTASGTLNMNGGTLIEKNGGVGNFVIGGRNAATTDGVGVLNLTNGYISVACGVRVGDYGTGTVNQYGGLLETTNAGTGINLRRQATGLGGTYHLNGGTLRTEKVTSSQTSGTRLFYFNGGTLQAGAGNLGSTPFFNNLSGAFVRNGGAVIDDRSYSIIISQALEHSDIGGDNATDGGLTKLGSGTLTLSNACSYTGSTTVSNGTLVVAGSLGTGTVAVNGGALAGTGTIGGAVTVNSGASLAPKNLGGTLTINGNLTLNAGSTNTFAVNGSTLANDAVAVGGTVAYGGVLNIVTNGAFSLGQTFTLFSGAGAASASHFASITGSPGSGLAFAFTNGVLSVITGVASYPTNITATVSGSTLTLTWPTTHLGWILQAQTNSLNAGLSANWIDIPASAAMSATNIIVNPANPTVFFRLRHP